MENRNRWAQQLGRDHDAALQRVADLQNMVQSEQAKAIEMAAAYQRTVDSLEHENQRKTDWALDTEKRLSAALAQKCEELAETVRLLDRAEATVVERTAWARDLQNDLQQASARLRMTADSRWVKLGRSIGVGPKV